VTADAKGVLAEADTVAQSPHRPAPLPTPEWVDEDGALH